MHGLIRTCWLVALLTIVMVTGCATPPPPPPPPPTSNGTPPAPPSAEPLSVVFSDADIESRISELAQTDKSVDREAVGYFMDVFRARVRRDLTNTGIAIDLRETSTVVTFPNRLSFESGSTRLTTGARALVDRLADILREYRATLIVISGHTDNVGDPDFNHRLSEARARSVAEYLADAGIDPSRLMIQGFGHTRPVAENNTESGRASNRRVELLLRLIVRRPPDPSAASDKV